LRAVGSSYPSLLFRSREQEPSPHPAAQAHDTRNPARLSTTRHRTCKWLASGLYVPTCPDFLNSRVGGSEATPWTPEIRLDSVPPDLSCRHAEDTAVGVAHRPRRTLSMLSTRRTAWLLTLTVLLGALEPAAPAFAGYRPTTPSARSRFAQLRPGRLRPPSTPSHGGGGGARFFRMGAIPRACPSLLPIRRPSLCPCGTVRRKGRGRMRLLGPRCATVAAR